MSVINFSIVSKAILSIILATISTNNPCANSLNDLLIDLPNTKASAKVLEKLDVAPIIDSKIVSVILKDSLCSFNFSPTDFKILFCSLCFSTP